MSEAFKKTAIQARAIVVMASLALHIMLYGGSRAGKTFIIIYALIVRACKTKSRHLILRRTFNSAKTSVWLDTLPKVISLAFPELMPSWGKRNKTDYYWTLPNGSEIWIAGLDDDRRVEKILGKEYSTIFFSETSQLSYSSIQIALTRLAEKNSLKKKVYYDSNPPSTASWQYTLFERKLNPIDNEPLKDPDNYISFLMNPMDNMDNIDENYLAMLEAMPEKERQRFMLGQYTDADDGRVYYAFNRDRHVRQIPKRHGTIFVCSDFNVEPTTSTIMQYYNNTFHFIDEIFLPVGDTYKLADALIEAGYRGCEVIPDSTGGNRKTSGISDHQILKDAGFRVRSTYNPYVGDRVNNMNRLFTADRIIIDPKCKKLINDFELVVWKNGILDQKTDKRLTHLSDGAGYGCWALDPIDSNFGIKGGSYDY